MGEEGKKKNIQKENIKTSIPKLLENNVGLKHLEKYKSKYFINWCDSKLMC